MLKKIVFLYFFSIIIFGGLYAQEEPTEFDSLYAKALAAFEQQHYAEAVELLTLAIEKNGSRAHYYMRRADCFYAAGNYKTALADYGEVQKINPNYALLEVAKCYARLEDFSTSKNYIEQYLSQKEKIPLIEIKNDPAFLQIAHSAQWQDLFKGRHYRIAETELDQAQALFKSGDITGAYNIVNERIARSKRFPRAYRIRGDIFMHNTQYRKAIKDYTQAIDLQQNDISVYLKRAQAYQANENFEKAAEDYQNILTIKPNELKYLKDKAQAEYRAGNYQQASQSIEKYAQYFIETPDILFLTAQIKQKSGDNFAALRAVNKAIDVDASKHEYFLLRANSYADAGMLQKAESDYSMALDLRRTGETFYLRAKVRIAQQNFEGACFDIKMAEHLKYYPAADLRKAYCR